MRRVVRIGIVVVLVAVVVAIATRLPSGYGTDLTQVGAGQPVVVLVHDHGIVQSGILMSSLDRVRGEFEPALTFLVADQNREEGERFAIRHQLPIATLGLFSAEGELMAVYSGPQRTPEEVRAWLEEHRLYWEPPHA